jgi:hypothetical protein
MVLLAVCANLGSTVRRADGRPDARDCHPHGDWVEPLAGCPTDSCEAVVISTLGGACALAWTALTGLANCHPPTEYPLRFFVSTAATIADPDGVADLGSRRLAVRGDATATDIQDRS